MIAIERGGGGGGGDKVKEMRKKKNFVEIFNTSLTSPREGGGKTGPFIIISRPTKFQQFFFFFFFSPSFIPVEVKRTCRNVKGSLKNRGSDKKFRDFFPVSLIR